VNVGQDKKRLKNVAETGLDLIGPKAKEKKRLTTATSYPLLHQIYDLSKMISWSNNTNPQYPPVVKAKPQKTFILSDLQADSKFDFEDLAIKVNYVDTVIHRRSKRNFIPQELDTKRAVALIRLAASPLEPQTDQAVNINPLLGLGITCQNVSDMEDGFYLYSQDRLSLLLMRKGQFQDNLSQVCLDQRWIKNAAFNFLFMINLAVLEKEFGPRGYRYVLMHSGRIAQRIYLAATGLGLGCCGVGALYDEEAQNLFELNNESALFYLVSTGPVKK
jgi:SagB-type dehydrogenase family enzyme